MEFISYGEEAVGYLTKKDKKLAEVIGQIGPIRRESDPDLFRSLANAIVGQQISSKAQAAVWAKLLSVLEGEVTPQRVLTCSAEELQGAGLSLRKVGYIQKAAGAIQAGSLDLQQLQQLPDSAVCAALSKLDGVGPWTAEMLLIFSMGRMDVLSYGDFGIRKGMRMVYRHREITPALFEKYRRRYSPYGTVASLYFWAVAGGAIPGLRDPAPKKA